MKNSIWNKNFLDDFYNKDFFINIYLTGKKVLKTRCKSHMNPNISLEKVHCEFAQIFFTG